MVRRMMFVLLSLVLAACGVQTATPVSDVPIIDGTTVSLQIDAYWGKDHPAITLRVGQTLIVRLPARPRSAPTVWFAEYDVLLLRLDPSITIEAPSPEGWRWQALQPGVTTIRLREDRAPCSSFTCDGGPPPRGSAFIQLEIHDM